MAITSIVGKTRFKSAYGKCRIPLYSAVTQGALVAVDVTNDGFILADASTSIPASLIAMEAGAAGATIWACVAGVVSGMDTETTGVYTDTNIAAAADVSSPLYVGESGDLLLAAGTIAQVVGFILSRTEFFLCPNTWLTGVNISASGTLDVTGNSTMGGTLTVTGATTLNGGLTMDTNKFTVADTSGNTVIGGTLTQTGVATFAAQDIHTLGLKVTTTAPIIGGVVVPKMLATAKTSGAGAWTITAAELAGGFIIDATATGGSAPTMPTVAAVVAVLPGYIAGSTILLVFKNTGDQTATLTTDASAQWTMEGIMTIITKETRMFLCRIESATAGTVYSIGHSTTTT